MAKKTVNSGKNTVVTWEEINEILNYLEDFDNIAMETESAMFESDEYTNTFIVAKDKIEDILYRMTGKSKERQ